ncbi:MAG: type II secretion system minor pseudopilin GspI [Pseudomonadota bacterium]
MIKRVIQAGRTQLGFTLVEVMVALFVVALALPALVMTISQYIDATGYMRDKSMAQMVAANKFEELRILSSAGQSLLRGSESGVATMADRDWYWRLDSQPTEAENFYRIEITVALDEEDDSANLFTLVAFMSADFRGEADLGVGGG